MSTSRWFTLIAMVVGLGCLQVAQRNAILLKGYAVGARMENVHTQETDLSWVNAHVVGLSSPTHLAQVVQERRLTFVAWSRLAHEPSLAGSGSLSFMQMAADDPRAHASGDDTAD